MNANLAHLRDGISSQLVGRDREATIITLALIAREHVLLVGPPGTGKSQLCRAASGLVDGARYCERLLSPTTAPEAVWGPVSISALREDRYDHIIDGYAADAHVLYLDEVGRASGIVSSSGVPVVVGSELAGVLEFHSTVRHPFDTESELVMRHLGAQLARVVERERGERRTAALAREVVRLGGDPFDDDGDDDLVLG